MLSGDAGSGFIDSKTLGAIFSQARSTIGFNAGVMVWEWHPTGAGAWLNDVYPVSGLQSIFALANFNFKVSTLDASPFVSTTIYIAIVCILILVVAFVLGYFLRSKKLEQVAAPCSITNKEVVKTILHQRGNSKTKKMSTSQLV